MNDESYRKALTTGVSDGTVSGNRGVQDHAARAVRVQDEANKLGERLMTFIAALFLHPYFSFVGFWLVCFFGMMSLAPMLGLSDGSKNNIPDWYGYSAIAVPVVLAILLRKIIPTLMRWVFFGGIAVIATFFIIKVVNLRNEKAQQPPVTSAVPAPAAASRSERVAAVQQALNDAANPETTFTAPGAVEPGELFEGVDLRVCEMSLGGLEVCQRYCATLEIADRPNLCR